ncbi:class I SAM-dependent methyltransferase [Schleiferiaceae bacterium]|nr:class I SAM-dependent methyltransferase [Schleiferiaceae bacterium]MDA8819121.1 class I SAM-dependent methyltransferase [Schleiferiaceae bacterium]
MSAAAEKEHTISIKPHEAEVLKELVLKYHVNTALEIGLAYGASAMTMLGAQSELKLTSCDPFQQEDYQNSGLSKIADAGFQSRHTHIKALSDQALPKLLAQGKTYDLIFIDGDHKFSGAFVDFHFATQMIENNGIVVFHDMWMRALILIRSYIKNNRPDLIEIPINCANMCAFQRIGKDERDGMVFKEFYTRKGYVKYHINRMAWERKNLFGKAVFRIKMILKGS